jgi:hypothetical protein
LRLLNARQVEYLLVGGYAVGYYGYPRATADLDIWIAINRQNAEKVVAVLREYGFDLPELSPELFLEKDRMIRMGVPPLRLEVITSISGVGFEECYVERVPVMVDDVEASLISLRHLKINKKASGRFKDLDDLENLP